MNEYKYQDWNDLLKNISSEIETTQASVKMQILNYKAILGEKGLSNYTVKAMDRSNMKIYMT